MACTVTKKDIRNQIAGELKGAFPSSVSTSYKEYQTVFIPYDASNPNKDVLYGKVKRLQQKYNSDYQSELVSFNQTVAGVEMHINPTQALADRMTEQNALDENEQRQTENEASVQMELEREDDFNNEFIYAGEIYPSEEDMLAAIQEHKKGEYSFMAATGTYNATNYGHYLTYKQEMLKKVTRRLNNSLQHRKLVKSSDLKSEIANLHKLKDKLENEIFGLKNDPNIFEKTMSVFNDDIALIGRLLEGDMPSLDNIALAQDMVGYFELISDYNDLKNDFVDTSDASLIEPEIKARLNELHTVVMQYQTKLNNAKKQYMLQAIDESENLKAIYPGAQLEEIRDKLLAAKSDISIASWLFATVDREFAGQDSLLGQLVRLELERSRNKNKAFAADKIQQINEIETKVKSKLLSMGFGVGKPIVDAMTLNMASEVNYTLFYQKTTNGNKTGRLIDKYSDRWFKDFATFNREINEEMSKGWQAKDYVAINSTLAKKYAWLNDRTDFIDVSRLPEILDNPEFAIFEPSFNRVEAATYKQELVNKIGEFKYNQIIEQQKQHLEDFMDFVHQEQQNILSLNGVTTLAELPDAAKHHYNILVKRNSPFEFINSHKAGQQGRVDYTIGTSGNQYQSQLKFNTFYPKSELERIDNEGNIQTTDSGYYDANFKKIEENPQDLLKFWEILSESASFMNTTLSDADTNLSHNSLLRMGQSMTDILINKRTGVANKTGAVLKETGQTMRELFSSKVSNQRASDVTEVNKGGIETIQAEVNVRYDIFKMSLSIAESKGITAKTKLDFATLSREGITLWEKLTGKTIGQLTKDNGGAVFFPQRLAKEYLTNQVMEEQTFNLPIMMKAYLDIVSEYKAQKDVLPKINVFKDLYNGISLAKQEASVTMSKPAGIVDVINEKMNYILPHNRRWRGQLRMEHWVNKQVKGLEDKEYWMKLGRSLSKDEKEFIKTAKEYMRSLDTRILESTGDVTEVLLAEKAELEYKMENIGMHYTAAAAYNTVVNRMSILVGLGYNIPSQIANRFQGWYQGMINDTGRYWTAGNFYAANAFINRKGLRWFSPQYKNEVDKTKLMIEKLNIIQDATNELDRARRGAGLTGMTSKLNPFYLTEYTEWHNQTPQILSVLMDHEITSIPDANGKTTTTKIFTGSEFPAFRIQDGLLVLKDEYRTEDNIATWEAFSNNQSGDNKANISAVIATLNGDYSKTGSTYIKSRAVGKTVMTFKTWLPNQIFQRFASNQTDITLGIENFDGAYAGALKNKKTSAAGTAGIAAIAGVAGTMGLGLGLGLIIPAALIGYTGYQLYKNRKNDGENLETMKQLSAMGQAIVRKAIGLPFNTIRGKNIIKAHTFNELQITDTDRQNLNFITNELVGLLWLTLFKVIIKGMLGDDEEKEPKTLANGRRNPNYPGDPQTQSEKERYHIFENTITRLIDDATLYTNPSAMYTTMMHPAGTDSWFKKIDKLSDGIKRTINGDDILQSGSNAGESQLGNALGGILLPGLLNEWAHGDFDYMGFKKSAKGEWNKAEYMDTWSAFNSDYKLDKKKAKSERAEASVKIRQYWESELGYDPDDTSEVGLKIKAKIDKKVKKELDLEYPLNIRADYDENQERIE